MKVVFLALILTPILGFLKHLFPDISPSPGQLIGVILTALLLVNIIPYLFSKNKAEHFFITNFIVFALVSYITIINLLYGKPIIDSLAIPIRILFLYLLFINSYVFFLKVQTSEKMILNFAYYTLFIIIGFMVWDNSHGVVYYSLDPDTDANSIGGGISYYAPVLLSTLPIFIYFNKKGMSIIAIIGILLTFRRSALLGAIALFVFNQALNKRKSININAILKTLLALLVFSSILYYMYYYTDFGIRLETRLSDTSGSGRSEFWGWTLYLYSHFDFVEKIWGNPTVLQDFLYQKVGARIGAHSDFLDFLVNFGLIGFLLFILFLFNIMHLFYKNKNIMPKEYSIALSSILSFILLSLTTGGLFDPSSSLLFCFLGFLLAKITHAKIIERYR